MQSLQQAVALAFMAFCLIACTEKTASTGQEAQTKSAKSEKAAIVAAAPPPEVAPEPIKVAPSFKAKPSLKPATPGDSETERRVRAELLESSRNERIARAPAAMPAHDLKSGGSSSALREADGLNSYLVRVEANKEIKMSIDPDKTTSGQLKVWIGQSQYEPQPLAGMATASSVLQTLAPAASAKITPRFPDDPTAFIVKPETSPCQGIDPTGSEVTFTITPTRAGQFRVGASVELFKNSGCQGDALTKTAEPTTVKVTVFIPNEPLLEIIWSQFKKFFAEIIGAIFAILIIVFRKRLKKIFGIQDNS